MVNHPSPNQLMILWALQEDYLTTVAPVRRSLYLSIKLEGEIELPKDPDPLPKPTAEDVPMSASTQAAYEVFSSIDNVLGEADDVMEAAHHNLAEAKTQSGSSPLQVEYCVTLRAQPGDRGVEIAYGVGYHMTSERESLLPRFLVVGDDGKVGQTLVRESRVGGAGVTFCVSMLEYCALLDDLHGILREFGPAADLPLPDGWLVGFRVVAFLQDTVAAQRFVADGLRATPSR